MSKASQQVAQEIIDWYNAENPQEHITEFDEVVSDFLSTLRPGYGQTEPCEIELPSGSATFETTEGGEGQGDDYLFRFKVGEKYFEVNGFHSSWEGVSWEGSELYEVEPLDVVVTKFFVVND